MTRKEVERIVGIFKNHGIDKETGKRVKENVIHDFFDEIDDLMGYEGASEVIFVPEEYGLDKEATIQEIVDYILENRNYSAPRLGYINFWSKQRKYNFCFIIALLRKVDNFSM